MSFELAMYNWTMVRTRIAPSPTGEDLHIGNLYTALFNWAFARKNNGQFIVRIEDTDRKRMVEDSEKRILSTLKKYGLEYDESVDKSGQYGPYRQSERLDIYKKYAEELVAKGKAYYCFCTEERLSKLREEQKNNKIPPRYDKHCLKEITDHESRIKKGESFVIRLNVPENEDITFHDEIRGDITINTNNIDDQVLIKSDGFPTYHLAVVVDDHLMEISHVIRGEEWIASTPKHLLLYRYFGWELPVYVHSPLLRNPDKSKLSKRKNPVWSSWYLNEGYLPDAMLNFLALMGWSHPEEKEIFSLEEFVEVIDLKRLSTVGPVFDIKKLEWLNGEYIRKIKSEELKLTIYEFFEKKYSSELIEKTIPLIQERIKTLKEYDEYCRFFIEEPKEYEINLDGKRDLLKKMHETLTMIKDWNANIIGEVMQHLAQDEGISISKFFMLLRVAMTGKKITPPLNESMEILGKEEVLKRISVIVQA